MRCPECGQDSPPGARFCLHCGSQLAAPTGGVTVTKGDSGVDRSTTVVVEAPREPGGPVGDYCPICGRYRLIHESFRCVKCGRAFICTRHHDERTFWCTDCAEEAARDLAERERRERQALLARLTGLQERAQQALAGERWKEARGLAEE